MRFLLICLVALFSGAALLQADVPHPGVNMPESVKQALRRMEATHAESDLAQQMQARKAARASVLSLQKADVMTMNVPLLLGTYDNSNNRYTREQFQNQIYDNNPTGTMVEYYREISYGQLELTGQTYGWYRTPQTESTYVGTNNGLNGGGARFTRDLVVLADEDIDYSQYDNDNDGYVDVVMIVHTGAGAETGANNIWSHRWSLNGASRSYPNVMPEGEYVTNDPRPGYPGQFIKVNDYIIQPEEKSASNTGIIDIGVFCHEFGHALGLPDLYDYDGSSEGIGNWGLMGGGAYGGDGRHPGYPAHMTAWSKEVLGWVEPIPLERKVEDLRLPNVQENQDAVYRIWVDGEDGNEYFLLENRQQLGFDRFIFEPGLLIWHVDTNILQRGYGVNNDESHKGVDLEEADGKNDLDFNRNRGDAGDPFPGAFNNRLFNDATQPNSRSYLDRDSGFAVRIDSLADTDIYIDVLFTPTLFVAPERRQVAYQSGSVTFDVKNMGGGAMTWQASTRADWLRLTEQQISGNDSQLIVDYDENTQDSERTAQIQITAADAEASPQFIELSQFAADEWISPLVVTDNNGEQLTLSFGQVRGATDGVDPDYESELSQGPVSNQFDARFVVPDIANGLRDDYRASTDAWVEWRVIFQASQGGYPLTLNWDPFTLPEGSLYLKDEFTGSLISVNMNAKDELVIPTRNISSLKILYSQQRPRVVNVESGWNLVSVPFAVENMAVEAVFPNAVSHAFSYDQGYSSATELQNGLSYWVKFAAAEALDFIGSVVTPQVIALKQGWNMIGPFEEPVAIADLVTTPANIFESEFLGFETDYVARDTLRPGHGYWVLSREAGQLLLPNAENASGSPATQTPFAKAVTTSEAYDFPLTVKDDAGNRKTLWFGLHPQATDAIDIRQWEEELPPLPPKGAFDARFVSGEDHAGSLRLGSYRDIRRGDQTFSGTVTHQVAYQPQSGRITLVWDLPEHISGVLHSPSSSVIHKEMRGRDSLRVSLTSAIPELTMTLTYTALPQPNLTVMAPNGGETWIVGQEADIAWNSELVDGPVRLYVSRDNGDSFDFIAETENSGSFTWMVQEPVSDRCHVRITDSSEVVVDESDATFAIQYKAAVHDGAGLPQKFALLPNYPNPFNPETTIAYQLPESAEVRLAIFNTRGALVRTLVNTTQAAGTYTVRWNGRNDSGAPAPSGVYFYRMTAGEFSALERMVLLK